MKHLKKFQNLDNLNKFKLSNVYKRPLVAKITNNVMFYISKIIDKYNSPYQRILYLENPGNDAVINTLTINPEISTQDLINASYIEYVTECEIPINYNGAEGINGVYFFIGTSDNYFYSGLGQHYHASNTANDGKRHVLKLIKENNQAKYYLDNNLIDTYTCINFNNKLDSFGIFFCKYYNGHLQKQKKYYSKLQINDTVLFELIPVRINSTGYMYDVINKKLYGTDNHDHLFNIGPDLIFD